MQHAPPLPPTDAPPSPPDGDCQAPPEPAPPCPAPRFRSDLIVRPQQATSGVIYVIEDPVRTRYFRLGQREYLLLAACDGTTTCAEAIALAGQAADDAPLTPPEATAALHWAARNELLERSATQQPVEPPQRPLPNPLILKFPLGNPEPLLQRLDPWLGWIHSPVAAAAGVVLLGGGLLSVVAHGPELVASLDAIDSPGGQLSLLICWIVLKVIHELSHAAACRRYGAAVRQAGVMCILFLPMAYVDVTSAWRLRSRWQRIHIAAAGMQLELYVGAAAAIAWPHAGEGLLQQTCANVALMAGISTVLFNANPLMRFDGYYILADWLRLPNLAVTANLWLRNWARQTLLGMPAAPVALPDRHAGLLRIYAVAAFLWRIAVCVGLIVAAAVMWQGAGLVLALAAAIVWFGVPVVRIVASLGQPDGPRLVRVAAACVVGLAACGTVASLPWPGACRLSGVVDYDPLTVVRTEVDGFVEHVAVGAGETVEAGALVARLKNDVLQRDLAVQQAQVAAAQLKIRQLRRRRRLAELEAEIKQLAALEEQLAELERMADALTIYAPRRGRVITRNVASLAGVFLEQGDPLLSLGDESEKQVVVAVPERRLDALDHRGARDATIALADGTRLTSRSWRIDPRASVRPVAAALCAPNGGALAVRESTGGKDADDDPAVELLTAHFTGRVDLDVPSSQQLWVGQRATVYLAGEREDIGQKVSGWLTKWLERRGVTW